MPPKDPLGWTRANIQIDGSDHGWFEQRDVRCTLLVFIDDATSRLMQLHFVPTESAFAYFEATRANLEQHGKPAHGVTVRRRRNSARKTCKSAHFSTSRPIGDAAIADSTNVAHVRRTSLTGPQICRLFEAGM
jgi:hypothetical protein